LPHLLAGVTTQVADPMVLQLWPFFFAVSPKRWWHQQWPPCLESEDKSTDIFVRCNPGLKIKLCCSSESAKDASGFIFTNSNFFIYPENGKKEVGRERAIRKHWILRLLTIQFLHNTILWFKYCSKQFYFRSWKSIKCIVTRVYYEDIIKYILNKSHPLIDWK